MFRNMWGRIAAVVSAAVACLLPKKQALPRIVEFSEHPFVERGHGKVLAGGAAANPVTMIAAAIGRALTRIARPAFALSIVVLLICLMASAPPVAAGGVLVANVGATGNPNEILNELKRAFEEFKASNDERIKQIETRGSADAVLVNKVEGLNTVIGDLQAQLGAANKGETLASRLEEIENRLSRPNLGGAPTGRESAELRAYREALSGKGGYLRSGVESGLRDLEIKAAVSVGTAADGGYALPEEIDRSIRDLELLFNPLLEKVDQITVGTSDYKKLVNKHGTASGWVGEAAARPATGTPALAEIVPPMGEIYAFPQATQWSLDDLFFNVEQWLAKEVGNEFAQKIGTASVTGDGANKPKGFLAYTTAATKDGVRAFGEIQHIATGQAAALSANPYDQLIDMVHALKPGHRRMASWAVNALVLATLRKVKDTTGNYIWNPSIAADKPETILGYAVDEVSDMPDIAANALPVALAHWKAAYLLVNRIGVRTIRDALTNKPYVGFYTTRRLGGALIDSEAIKLLKVAAA